ncbi:MAG: Xaa-Pro aminopeptidase [Planctomycetia bacterium]
MSTPPSQDVYARRRQELMRRIGPDGAALFVATPQRTRSNDTEYDYRPHSDLWYLTGFEEPGSALLLLPGHEKTPEVVFVRKRDREREIWDGFRLGVDDAAARLGVSLAAPIDDLFTMLPALLQGRASLVYTLGLCHDTDRQVVTTLQRVRHLARRGQQAPHSIHDPGLYLHEMRLVKTPAEIELLRTACRVSAEGHLRGMRMTRPGLREYELQAEIEYVFRRSGARAPGYTTIVGGGKNACVLHYIENRDALCDGDLVLVDAGAEVGWYTGDITRTWPVNGRFTGHQRAIYDLVLRAQMDVIRMVKPGLPWHRLHEQAVRTLTEGLVDLGVLQGPVDAAIEKKAFRKHYMHGTGHWLGIDVHDVGIYARPGETGRPLEPGMVFTVEPGLYFHADEPGVPERFRGIGVRIEDDVLVTENGCEVLTAGVPKEPEEIEALVGRGA